MFSPKNILLIQNFDFEDGNSPPKDKFLIVLVQTDDDAIIAPLPSSKDFVPDYYDKHKTRCIKDDPSCIHCYFFPADHKIGINGFSFFKDTYVYVNSATLKKRSLSNLKKKYVDTGAIKLNDILTDEEYGEFLCCIYKSKFVPRGVRRSIEPVIESLGQRKNL